MAKTEEIKVSHLWSHNSTRQWIRYLCDAYFSGHGHDFETISYWISQFKQGKTSTLIVDREYTMIDGHHRLIAASICGLDTLNVIVCPQKTTYGR